MNFGERDKNNLNVFIFISLVIHAAILWANPDWTSFFRFGVEGTAQGGMIRVTYVQSSTAKELSPITDPSSTTSVPQVEQPRPTEEPPKEHAASMPVIPDSEEDITPPVRPRPQPAEIAEPEEPVVTQPLPEPEPEVETETEQEPITGEIITSETGREVYIDDQAEPEPIEPEIEPVSTQDPEQLPDDVVDSEPSSDHIEQEPEPGDTDASGTGTGIVGDVEGGSGSIQESGKGEAEVAPPPPPPPAASSVINVNGNGGVAYPKDAQDEKSEGVVRLDVFVGMDGRAYDVVILQYSEDPRLDQQARLTFLRNWEFRRLDRSYILTIDVSFSILEGPRIEPIAIRWVQE
ncbi:MAG: TonB family protein [Firmicutes bacterium]|jgi:TonB family protein|nr:TonB family protein [Bacillota bacterium]NLL88028.1 TonB family protein [Bacillota bacterium]HKM18347.1 TonB family protein [Limnochordia bacterium]